jgi:hypothetical protein
MSLGITTFGINDTKKADIQHNDTQLSVTFYVTLSVIMTSLIMLSVVVLCAVMLSVVVLCAVMLSVAVSSIKPSPLSMTPTQNKLDRWSLESLFGLV